MRLSTLLQDDLSIPSDLDREIAYLSLDSRTVKEGSLFFAVAGHAAHGRAFIDEAISRGARAILIESDQEGLDRLGSSSVPLIPVPHLKERIGILASRFHGEPSKQLRVIGVTGTNGKTTCTHMIAQILNDPCAVIGTLGIGLPGILQPSPLTTPDALTLQQTLHSFLTHSIPNVALEVTSHSIDQGRINGITFDTSIFTNLTQDHLDYHGDMESYASVKRRFMMDYPSRHVVINADDHYGASWLKSFPPHPSLFVYTMQKAIASSDRFPVIFAEDIVLSSKGMSAYLHTPWGEGKLFLPLIGRFNLSNALPVIASALLGGQSLPEVLDRLSYFKSVPGRLQRVSLPEDAPLVVVDFAHTPDALKNVLLTLRPLVQGKLICVFGCGGNRDRLKRPLMARCAEAYADQVIVTNDNQRDEEAAVIAGEIMQGFVHPEAILLLLDRASAIAHGIRLAKPGDCVLIAGRGGETHQKIGDRQIPFNDAEMAFKLGLEK